MKKYLAPATQRGIANSAAVLREVADHAADLEISIGLEVVNRYETNILNTAAQALRFLDLVARPNVTVHLDSYHMNIEESGLGDPVDLCGDRLGYVHIGENHRGYLGSGSADLASLFRALDRIGYDGPVVFEAFSSAVVSPTLSNALGIWRELWSDGDDLGQHAAMVIRDLAVAARHANAQTRTEGRLALASS